MNQDKPISDATLPAQDGIGRKSLAWLLILVAVFSGIYFLNPAIALLGGLSTRLALDINPIPNTGKLGKLSLQTAIVLLGFTLGLDRLISVSADYGAIVAVYVIGTLVLGYGLLRLIRTDEVEGFLLTGGTAICGGTAIATLAPLMDAKPHQFAVATALVFLLNVVALFVFPYIGVWLEMSQETFGAWVALAIHDTSSVVATAAIYGEEAAEVATTVKLGRTLWLVPIAFAVSVMYRQGSAKIRVPLFVLLFVAAAVFSSFLPLTEAINSGLALTSKVLLVIALGMIGLEINRETLAQLSLRSVAFGVGLWLLVVPFALVLVMFV
ncbi:MAG: putative sulfate exporter family transporter [Pseudomonadales bacterium]|nr:putative sulfate exporter family transporter [Pseudomonadales bacterium]